MNVKLSSAKLEFVLDKIITHFEMGNRVDVESNSYSTIYKFEGKDQPEKGRGYINAFRYSIHFDKDDKKITLNNFRVSGAGDITYTFNKSEDKNVVNSFTKRFFNKIYEIENAEFKKLFSTYDDTEERNEKLSDLLKEEKAEKLETPTDTNTVVTVEKKKKGWFFKIRKNELYYIRP